MATIQISIESTESPTLYMISFEHSSSGTKWSRHSSFDELQAIAKLMKQDYKSLYALFPKKHWWSKSDAIAEISAVKDVGYTSIYKVSLWRSIIRVYISTLCSGWYPHALKSIIGCWRSRSEIRWTSSCQTLPIRSRALMWYSGPHRLSSQSLELRRRGKVQHMFICIWAATVSL